MEPVRLKPLFSLHPFVAFLVKVMLAFAAIGFFPSFLTDSRRVRVMTFPSPLEVSVDGVPVGISPANLKLGAGYHSATVTYGGRTLAETKFRVRHALFFSYIFEYSQIVGIDVSVDDGLKREMTRVMLSDAVRYSTLFECDRVHVQKPYFAYYAELLGDDADMTAVMAATSLIANQDSADDCERAFGLASGFVPCPDILVLKPDTVFFEYLGDATIGGVRFCDFGTLRVMKDEVTADLYSEFLSDRPEWSRKSLDSLEADGLCDGRYLEGFGGAKHVSGVSYYACVAFCDWFSKKHGVRARLLTAGEYSGIFAYKSHFTNIDSGLYEITSTPFFPGDICGVSEFSAAECESVLSEYGVDAHRRLFSLSSLNSSLDDGLRLSLAGVIPCRASYETAGFRIAVEN